MKFPQFSKLNFRFEVSIYLVSHVIQKMHDGFKMNESVCVTKFEQRYVITVSKYLKTNPNHGGQMKKQFIIRCQFYCNTFNDRCVFLKSTSYYAPLIALFSKYFFASSAQSVYRGCYIYLFLNFKLIYFLKMFYFYFYYLSYDRSRESLIKIINKSCILSQL